MGIGPVSDSNIYAVVVRTSTAVRLGLRPEAPLPVKESPPKAPAGSGAVRPFVNADGQETGKVIDTMA